MNSSPSSSCCIHAGKKAGKWWTNKDDDLLLKYIKDHGVEHWRTFAEESGLDFCCKRIRFRYMDRLRPGVKRGNFTPQEADLILELGGRWAQIAKFLLGRTDNEIKNYYNTHLKNSEVEWESNNALVNEEDVERRKKELANECGIKYP